MAASKAREWADWVDVEEQLPWLTTEPYLLQVDDLNRTVASLDACGFQLVSVQMPEDGDLETKLLIELSKQLGFALVGSGSWAEFSDRLWDLLSASWNPPIAVMLHGSDQLLANNLHVFLRCLHNLLSLTEAVGLSHSEAQRQVVYFFVGSWQ